jgi:hypothetical protein
MPSLFLIRERHFPIAWQIDEKVLFRQFKNESSAAYALNDAE